MNKTYGKIDKLAAVDAVTQMRAIGTHADDGADAFEMGRRQGIRDAVLDAIIEAQRQVDAHELTTGLAILDWATKQLNAQGWKR